MHNQSEDAHDGHLGGQASGLFEVAGLPAKPGHPCSDLASVHSVHQPGPRAGLSQDQAPQTRKGCRAAHAQDRHRQETQRTDPRNAAADTEAREGERGTKADEVAK